MLFIITTEIMIIIAILSLVFLPQIHLLLIFTIFGLHQLMSKIIKFIIDYILVFVLLFIFYSILYNLINFTAQYFLG